MIAALILRIFRQRCSPFALFCFLCFSFVIPVSAAPPPGHYLVWSDEFNGTSSIYRNGNSGADTTGPNAFLSGSSAYNSSINLSADGRSLVFVGYNSPVLASGSIDSSSSATVPRAVGSVNASGVFTLNATTTQFSGGTIRSAVADGLGNFWAGGGNSGVVYLGNNSSSATISASPAAMREMKIINGKIYFTQTSAGYGVMTFNGAPTSSTTPTLVLDTSVTGGTPSPKGFAFNSNLTIAYVADNRSAVSGGGIQRFNWNGTAWVHAYTLSNTLTSSQQTWSLTVDFSGANPIIYAITGETTANSLVSVTDAGPGSAFSILETAPTGHGFRGVAFTPSQ